jgi:biopolymer transport protein ExbD
MTALRAARTRRHGDDPILPLINIVFLLLIFFMLAGRLATTDPFDLEPAASTSAADDAPDLMVLQVGRGGEVAIDGEIIAAGALDRALAQRLAAAPPKGVRIKADGAAAAGDVIALVARLGAAGIEDLRLMTMARPP